MSEEFDEETQGSADEAGEDVAPAEEAAYPPEGGPAASDDEFPNEEFDPEEFDAGAEEDDLDEGQPITWETAPTGSRVNVADPARFTEAALEVRGVRFVPAAERQTRNVLTEFEVARVVAARTDQIGKGSQYFVDRGGLHQSSKIAFAELAAGRCPFDVWREVGRRREGGREVRIVEVISCREARLPSGLGIEVL